MGQCRVGGVAPPRHHRRPRRPRRRRGVRRGPHAPRRRRLGAARTASARTAPCRPSPSGCLPLQHLVPPCATSVPAAEAAENQPSGTRPTRRAPRRRTSPLRRRSGVGVDEQPQPGRRDKHRAPDPLGHRRLPIAFHAQRMPGLTVDATQPAIRDARGQRARWSRRTSSSSARSALVRIPIRPPIRSTATDLTCSAWAFESPARPVA